MSEDLDEYCEICDGGRPLRPEFIRRILRQKNEPKIYIGTDEELDRRILESAARKRVKKSSNV